MSERMTVVSEEELDRQDIELKLLLEAIYLMYGYDFRSYSKASVKRRVQHRLGMSGLTSIAQNYLSQPIPIVTHGYDYALPDGRGFWGGWGPLPGPWLQPGFQGNIQGSPGKGFANRKVQGTQPVNRARFGSETGKDLSPQRRRIRSNISAENGPSSSMRVFCDHRSGFFVPTTAIVTCGTANVKRSAVETASRSGSRRNS